MTSLFHRSTAQFLKRIAPHMLTHTLTLAIAAGSLLSLASCNQLSSATTSIATSAATTDDETKTVTILGQFSGEQQAHFEASIAPFEDATGIDVIYESTDKFNTLLSLRIVAYNTPDLVVLPQPGLMADLARDGLLVPLTDILETKALRISYADAWLDLGTVDNVPYGLWYRASVKSLVWYRPTAFETKGYDIPRTWAELTALSDRIVAEGGTPWCIGFESGAASGWPGTDWMEDILLRTSGPEAYRQWISHELPFNSPPVLNAFNEFGKILRNPKYVSGGIQKTLATSYQDSSLGIFQDPPECYMHRQGNFIASSFPEEKIPRIDYDVFLLPEMNEQFGAPLLVAGDAIAMFHHTPASEAFIKYMATPKPHEIGASLGGFISPQKQVSVEAYPDLVSANIAQILKDAEVISFDASDLMPGYVGTNAFWGGILDFANGKSAEDVAKTIDNSWP